MEPLSAIRGRRGERLRPLYAAAGDITVAIREDTEVYRRGDVEVSTEGAGDEWVFHRIGALVRWEEWLRKARLGTVRWLADQEGQLSAGSLHTTAAVRSQLLRAGLVAPSDLWGDQITEDGYRLALWARFEVDRRQV